MAFFGKCFAILFLCSFYLMTNAAPKNLEDEQVEETTVLFAEKPTNVTASRGDTVTFSCDITYDDGKPVPADDESIISIWLKDALVQMAGTQKLTKNPRLSVEGRSLVVSDVTLEDAGSYACQLSTWGQPRLEHHLVVYTAPTVKAEKSKIVATAGDDVVLSCNATGSPTPTISWKIKDEPVASGESSLTGKQLTLEQVSHRQAGKYACIADNGVGEPAKATIELDVMYKPVIKIDKAWIHSGENNQAELTCVIHGQPNPQVVWFRNGDELEKDSPHWTQSKVDGNTYTLELKNLKREHFGTYECRASNTIGRSEGMIELSGVAREAVFTSAPNGNLEDSFRLSWTVESYSPIKEYLLKYRKVDLNETNAEDAEWSSLTVPAEQQQPKDSTVSHSHSHEFLLKGLEKATEYEVSLQVVNTFGSNKPSIFRFATLGSTVSTWTSGSASMSVCTILTVVSAVVLTMVRL